MVMESKPQTSLEERAEILKENGINVVNIFDEDSDVDIVRVPAIQFNGNVWQAFHAASIMADHGIDVHMLRHMWIYGPGKRDPGIETWSLEFYRC